MRFTELQEGAIVLEGGGMRGIYTAGVLDFLMEKNLYFENCYAVSAGACNACNYYSKQKGRSYDIDTKYAKDGRYAGTKSYLTTGNYFNKHFTMDILPKKLLPYDYIEYRRTNANLYAVTTNVRTGKAEYLKIDDMDRQIDYVWASCSLPLLSRKVKLGNNIYLDGGVADSIPVARAIKDGHKKIVVVLTRDKSYRKKPNSMMGLIELVYMRYPKFIDKIRKRHIQYNKTLKHIEKLEKEGRIYVIRPTVETKVGRLEKDVDKLKALYWAGYEDARNSYMGLVDYLN